MPEFRLSKEKGAKKLEIIMAVDYDSEGNIENQEFYDGIEWCDNPTDLRYAKSYCDEEAQEDWNIFFNSFMHLLESDELMEKIIDLKELDDNYYFSEEEIDIVVIEED